MKQYWTVVIPTVPDEFATVWHAPDRTLTRGSFATSAEAIAWARDKLAGTPYSLELEPKPWETREQGFADGVERGLGVLAGEPSEEYLEGLHDALSRSVDAIKECLNERRRGRHETVDEYTGQSRARNLNDDCAECPARVGEDCWKEP